MRRSCVISPDAAIDLGFSKIGAFVTMHRQTSVRVGYPRNLMRMDDVIRNG
jgi:hypothetical protein